MHGMMETIYTLLLLLTMSMYADGYMYHSESSSSSSLNLSDRNSHPDRFTSKFVSGGGSYEPNSIATLGDLDSTGSADDYYKNRSNMNNHNRQPLSSQVYRPMENSWASSFYSTDRSQPPPIRQMIYNFFVTLHQLSPTLSYGTVLCSAVFVLWQIPELARGILQKHFVCNYMNVVEKKRLHSTLLCALSHSGFRHFLLNMYAYVSFGGTVKNAIDRQNLRLFPFVLGSAIVGSLFHLLLSRDAGSLGLSGVTLAMFAFVARMYPSRQFRVIFFPGIRVYAQHALIFAVCVSVFGIITGSNQGIAHATHLGGLIFGLTYYEAFLKGLLKRRRR